MSYVRRLMQAIATDINRPISDFETYIQALERNWYDTRDALLQVKDTQLFQLNIPGRLIELIKQKVAVFYDGPAQSQQPQQKINPFGNQFNQPSNSYNQQQSQNSMSMGDRFGMQRGPSRVESLLQQVRSRVGQQQFLELSSILHKIFYNIRTNLQEEKYRTVKKGNTLGRLYQHPQFVELLQLGGFVDGRNEIVMPKLDLSHINQFCDEIERNARPKFNPFQASISSLVGTIENVGNDSSALWGERLAQLERDREVTKHIFNYICSAVFLCFLQIQRLMSTPVKNRDVKITKFNTEQSMIKMFEKEPEDNPTEDEQIFIQNIKENLKKLEEGTQFASRRKAEYEALLKRPCFSETLVRVRLPDNTVFEAKFSPAEKLSTLVSVFQEYMVNKNLPYYLYMTPPVQKLEKKLLNETFYNVGCVPRALFYFGCDVPISGDILKQKSGFSFFGF